MSNQKKYDCKDRPDQTEHKRGPTSFWMHDRQVIFRHLQLNPGDCFLDVGCGLGDYTVYASKIIGESGTVYALDRVDKLISDLKERAESEGLKNIKAKAADISRPLPVEDNCVDVCLIATVLHILDLKKDGKKLIKEVRRVLKPSGRLIIIDCKKEDESFGPPMNMRVSAQQVEDLASPYGFEKIREVDLGFNYMLCFTASESLGLHL